ncbi:MAG: DUF2779 domain-containing protein [Phycisphaerae bacterium]|nr:DUF2779 domain-containing protein [Phycisphaerae bacterium]
MPPRLRKDVVLAASACKTLAWRMTKEPLPSGDSPGDDLRREEGIEIGRRARGLWPDGVLVTERDPDDAEVRTKELLAARDVKAIFEATLVDDGAVARADILERITGGWRLIEVKSSLNPDEHLDDLTYTASVFRGSGVRIVSYVLFTLDRAYRLGDPDWKLFKAHDLTSAVRGRLRTIRSLRESVAATIRASRAPAAMMVPACRTCPYFATTCLGHGIAHPLFELPRSSEKLLSTLWNAGIRDVAEVPASAELTADQRRVRDAIVSGERLVDRAKLAQRLGNIASPTAYLDFEAVKTALPLWPGVAPHEQVLTQYSIQWRARAGAKVSERCFLARHDRDDREALATRLVRDLRGAGSIVVYSSFEKTMLKGLAAKFPHLAHDLDDVVARLYDLLGAVQPQVVCDPQARGRTSIKAVLPALVPSMGYDGLAIGDGDAALAAFARMAQGRLTKAEIAATRSALQEYCGLDTMAMVKLHDALTALL